MINQFSAKARAIFAESLGVEPERRISFVTEACGDDAQLRSEVDALTRSTFISGPREHGAVAARLSPGNVLSNRFRIVRFVASGGMGEVYEAEDLELHDFVALKTIRVSADDAPSAIDRFRREVQLSRKVTHPNVCRVFDLARDESESRGSTTFLTMQLLRGETLAARLRRTGRMSTAEALPLALDMTDALSAAHAAGIIHRDFKPGNVILVPSEDREHAVITDFGLAMLNAGPDTSTQTELTKTGAVVGTLAYMAPEQLSGGEVTLAADIYALGIVLYEMVTGSRPFACENGLLEANRRLTEYAPSPRLASPDLSPAWDRAILGCLARQPEQRLVSAADVAKCLRGEPVQLRTRRKPRFVAAVIAAACVFLALVGVLIIRTVPAKAKLRRSVVVLPFKNVTKQPATEWVSTELSEGLRTQLGSSGQVRTISGEETAGLAKDFGLAAFDSLGAATLAKLHRVGADVVILGSYTDLGQEGHGRIHLSLQIQDAGRGDTVGSLSADGTETEIPRLVADTGRRLRIKLGLTDITATKERELAAAQPSAEAAPAYAAGLDKLRKLDAVGAQQSLQEAVAADPDFPFAHAALAEAWSILGYDGKAREESKKAYELSGKLGLEDRLLVEGRYHEMIADWNASIQNYSQLHKYFPDNLEYALRLAHAQMLAGKSQDAISTLDVAAASFAGDPRIDLERAEALTALGDYRKAQAAATSAIAKASANGTRLPEARALIWLCEASLNLGQLDQAKSTCLKAREIDSALGDRLGLARAATGLGNAVYQQGDMAGAKTMREEALRIARDIGSRRDISGALNNLGEVLAAEGKNQEAEARYTEALTIQRGIGFVSDMPGTLSNLADLKRQAGKLDEAAKLLEEAIATAKQSGSKRNLSAALTNDAGVLFQRGLISASEARFQEAMALQKEIGAKGYVAASLTGLGDLLLAKGDPEAAQTRYKEADALDRELGDKLSSANAHVGLASVLLERGEPKEAEAEARGALQVITAEKDPNSEVLARVVLARALVAQSRVNDAQAEVAACQARAADVSDVAAKFALRILSARVQFAADRATWPLAEKELRSVAAYAEKIGMPGSQLEAELAAAQIEKAVGKTAAAQSALADVRKRAVALGFAAIAKRAA